jgi:hypothetical protein
MGDNSFKDNQNRSSGIEYSQIIKFAVCVDNNDPRRAGRVRGIKNEGDGLTDAKIIDPLKAIIKLDNEARLEKKYKPWDKEDPYLFAPFLPLHINVIPRRGEAIKCISYETVRGGINQEYVGPLISQPGEIMGDNYSSGMLNTSFGSQNTPPPDFAPEGIPLPEGKGSFPNPDDIAIVGRDNCDIVLGMREKSIIDETETLLEDWYPQILIRSGKLIKNNKFTSRPSFNKKPTFIQLNTFPQTLLLEKKEVDKILFDDVPLTTLIEYRLDQTALAINQLSGYVVIYKMPYQSSTNDKVYMSGEFNSETNVPLPELIEACRMTFNNVPTVQELGQIINNFISQVDGSEWSRVIKPVSGTVKTFNPNVDLNNQNNVGAFLQKTHPLYFRPDITTLRLMNKAIPSSAAVGYNQMKVMSNELKKLVNLGGIQTKGYGLAFTEDEGQRVVTQRTVKTTESEIKSQDTQQGIISAGAEKIYLLSYNSAEINGPITLDTNYGIGQEKFITNIEDKTNSLVRGENLLELLQVMVNFISNHTHAFPGMSPVSQAHDGTRVEDLSRLLLDAPKTILNQNIRIN